MANPDPRGALVSGEDLCYRLRAAPLVAAGGEF